MKDNAISHENKSIVFNMLFSTVVPGKPSGDEVFHEFSNLDLAMKLHYLKGIYFFKSEVMGGFKEVIIVFKEAAFGVLELFYEAAGRVRRRKEDGRFFLKCNDAGVRFVEAECGETMEEWLSKNENGNGNGNREFIYGLPLGPGIHFSPFVFLQVTRFKCGGISLGLHWAHILGDVFSAVNFMNNYGKFISGQTPCLLASKPSPKHQTRKTQIAPNNDPKPFKRIDPVGDNWVVPNTHPRKMDSHSFRITDQTLHRLKRTDANHKTFEILCALIWKSMAKIRSKGNSLPRVITICRNYDSTRLVPGNGQRIEVVEAHSDLDLAGSDLGILAGLVSEKYIDETESVEESSGDGDLVVYGGNLTFVDLEGADLYGMESMGQKADFVEYSVEGVGDEGVVLVQPWWRANGDGDRLLNVTLGRGDLEELKRELRDEWDIS